jgi:hypothetical protein
MPEQSIACPSCGKKIPLTRALRAEIEQSVERELRAKYEQRLEADVQRAEKDAASKAEKKLAQELVALRDQINEQAKDLDEARRNELAMRRRERELERKQQDLELEMERKLGQERARLVADTQERFAEEHRLKDAEKERQLADMRARSKISSARRSRARNSCRAKSVRRNSSRCCAAAFRQTISSPSARACAGPTCIRSLSTRAAASAAPSSGNARTPSIGTTVAREAETGSARAACRCRRARVGRDAERLHAVRVDRRACW